MNDWTTWLTIAGLTVVTVLTRNLFLLSDKPWPLPVWAQEALRVAPLAALVAVVAPEIFMSQGAIIGDWRDARWPAALVASLYYFWRRDMLGTIVSGMAVLLVLKLGLGW